MYKTHGHNDMHNNLPIDQISSASEKHTRGVQNSTFQTDPEEPRYWFESPGVGWKCFREPRHRLQIIRAAVSSVVKVRESLGIWKRRWLRYAEDKGAYSLIGEYRSWLGLIAAPGQRSGAAGKDYWPGTNVCCRYLVGAHVSSGYLGWYQCQSRTSTPLIEVLGWACLV